MGVRAALDLAQFLQQPCVEFGAVPDAGKADDDIAVGQLGLGRCGQVLGFQPQHDVADDADRLARQDAAQRGGRDLVADQDLWHVVQRARQAQSFAQAEADARLARDGEGLDPEIRLVVPERGKPVQAGIRAGFDDAAAHKENPVAKFAPAGHLGAFLHVDDLGHDGFAKAGDPPQGPCKIRMSQKVAQGRQDGFVADIPVTEGSEYRQRRTGDHMMSPTQAIVTPWFMGQPKPAWQRCRAFVDVRRKRDLPRGTLCAGIRFYRKFG